MSNLTQVPQKVFLVDSLANVTTFIFFLAGDDLIVQTNDVELGNTLKDFSGKVKAPAAVLVDLIKGTNPLVIDFESEEKNYSLTIYQPVIKRIEEGF